MVDLAAEDLNRHADFLLARGKDPLVEMKGLYDMKLTMLRPYALFECEGFIDEDECKTCPYHCPLFPDEEDYQSWSDEEVPLAKATGAKKKEKKNKPRRSYKKECHIPLVGKSPRGGLGREKKDAKTQSKNSNSNSKRDDMKQGDEVPAGCSTYKIHLSGPINSDPQCGNKDNVQKTPGEKSKKKMIPVVELPDAEGYKETNSSEFSQVDLTRNESLHLYLSDDSDDGEAKKKSLNTDDNGVTVIKILRPTKRPKWE